MMKKVVNVCLSAPEQVRDEENITYPKNGIEHSKYTAWIVLNFMGQLASDRGKR
jgi:hypothetical protein